MPSTTIDTYRPFPDPVQTLTVLDAAMREHPVEATRRVVAADDSRSIDEGLAVLRCYVAIEDRDIRQALLDVLVRVAADVSE